MSSLQALDTRSSRWHGAGVTVRPMTAVIAHRGASKAFPENTVAAFEGALAMGADMVELDVRRTADGRLAVHHDARARGRPGDLRPVVERPAV